MDFVGYFGFPNGDAPHTSSRAKRTKSIGRNVKSKSSGPKSDSEDELDLALSQLNRKTDPPGVKRQLKVNNGSKAESSRSVGGRTSVAKRQQLDLNSFMSGSSSVSKAKSIAIKPASSDKKPVISFATAPGDEMRQFVNTSPRVKSTNKAAAAPHNSSRSTNNKSSLEPKVTTKKHPIALASSLLQNTKIRTHHELEEPSGRHGRQSKEFSDKLLEDDEGHYVKRIKISQDDSMKVQKKESVDDESQDVDNSECEGSETSANEPDKSIKRSHQLEERKRNNSRIFSIHSTLYGRPQLALNQDHSSRLLRGKGTTNILSHLFQRSLQRPRQCLGMNSYIQSGEHWNVCNTVQLSHDQARGEVCSMSFDEEGVLLATGDSKGFVKIYDFDEVNALDIKKRNAWNCLQAERDDMDTCVKVGPEEVCDGQLMSNDANRMPKSSDKTCVPSIQPALSKPVLAFYSTSDRVSDLQWNPNNQDQLAVAFAQSQQIHLYDVGSSLTPPPCLKIGVSNNSSIKGREGVSAVRFLTPLFSKKKKKPALTQLLTSGTRGTVRLWSIPKLKRGQQICDVSARCHWSVDISENGTGSSDMLVLPSAANPSTDASAIYNKPMVLLSGNAGSLVLLDTSKCTRKSFSTSVTPTIQSTWDLCRLASRELSKLDKCARLPARNWMAVARMSLLDWNCVQGLSSYRMSLVLKCGWVLAATLTVSQSLSGIKKSGVANSNDSYKIRVEIVNLTPRVQAFNSSNERVDTLGGVALTYSLPDIPVSSSALTNNLRQLIWLTCVKPRKFIIPSKNKDILCDGKMSSDVASVLDLDSGRQSHMRNQGEGMFLLDVTPDCLHSSPGLALGNCVSRGQTIDPLNNAGTLARLKLVNGNPLSVAMHPAGEWMVIGYALSGRAAEASLELVCMRKGCH